MRTMHGVIFFIIAFAVQSTLLRYFTINGVAPNLLLCLVIVFAFLYDRPYGIVFGTIFGVLWDISFGIYVGISSIALLFVALAMILLKKFLNHELLLPALVGGLAGSLINNGIYWGLYMLLGIPHSMTYILKSQPTLIVYNTVLVLVLHLILRRGVIRHRRDQYYKGGFREASGFRF
ncbi:hypothetical protein FACS1894127_4050 [Clostridia bacterium]|nr:hypothetical protein FACS1894127_4050 [Clostridia bacterium]